MTSNNPGGAVSFWSWANWLATKLTDNGGDMSKYLDYVARDNGEYGVIYSGEPAHEDSAGSYHHDVYHMRGGLKVDKFHEYNPAQWSPWGASSPDNRG